MKLIPNRLQGVNELGWILVYVTDFQVQFATHLVQNTKLLNHNEEVAKHIKETNGFGYVMVTKGHKNGPSIRLYKNSFSRDTSESTKPKQKIYRLYYICPFLLMKIGLNFGGRQYFFASKTKMRSSNGSVIPIISYCDDECQTGSAKIRKFTEKKNIK